MITRGQSMSRRLLRRIIDWFRPVAPVPQAEPSPIAGSALPEGMRIYAIGDIHGFASLLGRMSDLIAADLEQRPPQQALAVFLGDYIDRGPSSFDVVDRLARGDFPVPFQSLRGNHEDLMLRALALPEGMPDWCQCGGLETLRSYGVDCEDDPSFKAMGKLRRRLLERFPDTHRAFLETTRLSFMAGDYFFVHAGARPGVALDRQDEADLMWIRDECYRSAFDFGKVLVHGHTPRRRPENLPNRINVDTGAFKWGVLSCVALERRERRFLAARD